MGRCRTVPWSVTTIFRLIYTEVGQMKPEPMHWTKLITLHPSVKLHTEDSTPYRLKVFGKTWKWESVLFLYEIHQNVKVGPRVLLLCALSWLGFWLQTSGLIRLVVDWLSTRLLGTRILHSVTLKPQQYVVRKDTILENITNSVMVVVLEVMSG